MILVGIGAIIGSGWLFASGLVASIAGPAGWISWVIGGSPCSCSVWSTLNYAVAPISAYALRRNAPDLPRPFYLKGISVIGPISFVIASLILY
jgi:amino acid transporter